MADVRVLASPFVTVLSVAGLMAVAPSSAAGQRPAPQPPCAACIAIQVTPGQALALPARLDGLTVVIQVEPGEEGRASPAVDDVARRGGRPGLLVEGMAARAVGAGELAGVRVFIIDIRGRPAASDPEQLAYTLKTQFTAARAAGGAGIELGLRADGAALHELLARDLRPYVDFLVTDGPRPGEPAIPLWRSSAAATLAGVLRETRTPGVAAWLWQPPAPLDTFARGVTDLARAAAWLTPGLVGPSNVDVRCGGVAAETFLQPQTLETIAIATCGANAPVAVTPAEPGVERLALSTGEALIRVPAPGAPDRFAAGVDVTGERRLTVQEIIARHQAAVARQAASIRTLISQGTLTLTFEAPGFPAPVTIASESTMFAGEGRSELAQQRIRVNGIEFTGGGVPRLPIIEPERVASPPLAITLSNLYRYRLEGTARIRDVRCYVVAFEPAAAGGSLFRGRAWIAADSFALVRVAAAQTGLRGPIVSSEQADDFAPDAAGRWLLARSDVRQMYEGAAHRTPIHRVLDLRAHVVNAEDFIARRQAVYASDAVMLRDTPEGFRYLRRERADAGTAAAAAQAPGVPAPVDRVVAGPANRVRTLVGGVIIDPNISIPLPFAGVSYVDFDLLNTGTQLSVFFGGSYGQLAFSVPSLGGSRWQLGGRAFGIASSYNDRAFEQGREEYGRNIRQRPAHASAWVLRPLTPRISIRAGYDLDYTRLSDGDLTAPDFVVPADQLVHGARFALEGQRAGWNAAAWWNPAIRQGWRAWGRPGGEDYAPRHGAFQRYGVSLARSAVMSPRLTGRVEGAWMGGRDLDRFSRYAFGTFDNRLRGYPAALIRYDRGAVARGALAWSAARFLRVDFFLDSARVRDPGFGRRASSYTGLGAALEGPAPFGTLVAAEWGYGIRGVTADGGTGTHVIRISAFKLF